MGALDADAKRLGQFGGTASMVEMAMGEQDFLQVRPGFRQCRLDEIEVAARVYHRRTVGPFAHQQGTVLLKRGDGNDGNFHEKHSCLRNWRIVIFSRHAGKRCAKEAPGLRAAAATPHTPAGNTGVYGATRVTLQA